MAVPYEKPMLAWIFEDPLIKTSHYDWSPPWLDGMVWMGSWLMLGTSALTIAIAFERAIRGYRHCNPGARFPRACLVFLALAAVALLVTNGLRFEHKRLRHLVRTFKTIHLGQANMDVPMALGRLNAVDDRSKAEIEARFEELWGIAERGFTPYHWRPDPYRLDWREASSVMRLGTKLMRQARSEIRAEQGVHPYFDPRRWTKANSTFDYFDLLVDNDEHMFWTTQWSLGFMAWALYVSIECGRYQIAGNPVGAFVCLGAFVSLATAQCLFFAILVLVPKRRGGMIRRPKQWSLIPAAGLQLFCLLMCGEAVRAWRSGRLAHAWDEDGFKLVSGMFKLCAFTIPMFFVNFVPRPEGSENRISPRQAKQNIRLTWYTIAILGGTMHIYFARCVWSSIDPRQEHAFFAATATHPWVEKRNPMDHRGLSAVHVFGMLGSSPWVNALAFDVLFSAAAIAFWSAMAKLDAKRMAECALFPWMDEMTEQMKIWKYHTIPEMKANGGLRGGATRSGADYHSGDPATAINEDEQPRIVKRAFSQRSREPSENPAHLKKRGSPRRSRKAPSRAPSEQAEEPLRRRSRSAGVHIPRRDPPERPRPSAGVVTADRSDPQERDLTTAEPPPVARRSERIRERLASRDRGNEVHRRAWVAGPAFEDRAGLAEQAGLTLGLCAFGGLGMASSAVFGAEGLDEE